MQERDFRVAVGRLVGFGSILTFVTFQYITIRGRNSLGFYDLLIQSCSCILLFNFLVIISRWIEYEPIPGTKDNDKLPTLSIIIPAYNESAFVRNSIGSVLSSDYPRHKIEVIVVDDGSKDDTWSHIQSAAQQAHEAKPPLRCIPILHEVNRGKRQAMVTAFTTAKNEILVTLDSDTLLDRQALRNLVSPFVVDSGIGGVTGHLSVFNVKSDGWSSFVPRTLDCLFEQNGNIPRAAQSKYGFVTILPGAISAFRRLAAVPHTSSLVEAKFLGHPLRHGEDVQLTMHMLRDGWRLRYQSNAVVYTVAPETFRKAFLMYVRWERSNYTYWMLGLVKIAFMEAVRMVTHRNVTEFEMAVDQEKQDGSATRNARQPDFHPILGIVCTGFSNFSCMAAIFTLARGAYTNPWVSLMNVGCLVVFATWSSTLLLADAIVQDYGDMAGLEVKDTTQESPESQKRRYPRLRKKMQYSCFSTVANFLFVSWASMFGLFTLRSQSWLTR
ncbi:hypothetical protein CkaCkLH20_07675 [Colletotrichum karsti]|uniref:Glycosyltransferase family 2 n=1 Tax=Colletotrichum karsti TaxID=1095194 RepID=A0A9P6LJ91_9PEZI|nr:uncharacterized protein CkaCkLH20_07675 [Colletotrichum karsti]KAF9874981.1 hypothetical protein CkaCkLH20_07675 [Colletotrichum karsti]